MDGVAKLAPVGFVLAVIAVLLAVVGSLIGQEERAGCEPAGLPTPGAEGLSGVRLSAEQVHVGTEAVRAVRAFPATAQEPRAAVIVLATGFQESRLRNLDFGDRDSLGYLQQRPSQGWGSADQVRDVGHATRTFLEHLVHVPHWRMRRITDVATDVQRPAEEYRGLYQQWVPAATEIVSRLWARAAPDTGAALAATGQPVALTAQCQAYELVSADHSTVYPVSPALKWSNRDNWGGHGGRWSSWHTGTDFSLPCGTPVVAAHAGTVRIESGQGWAGRWLVKVAAGPGELTTWYAHMQSVAVERGAAVRPGQQLGEVGAEGNATGCHLHFEVHTRGGSIYGSDNVDPTRWLEERARPE